jgi:hypothetical protein
MSKLDHAKWFDYLHQIEDDIKSGVIDVTPYVMPGWSEDHRGISQLPDNHPVILKLNKMVDEYHENRNREKLCDLYERGFSIRECALRSDFSIKGAKAYLEEHGLLVEEPVAVTANFGIAQVELCIGNGMSIDAMAERFQITVEELKDKVRQHINLLQEVF